jgi:EmrB/QacA subfamily drug resistance transporter
MSTTVQSPDWGNKTKETRSPSPWLVHALTSMALFATFLDTTVLYFAFPSIRQTFRFVSDAELSWVLNGYSIVFAAVLLPGGRLADHFGRRRMFLLGCIIFTLSSLLCGLAVTPWMLILFRLIQATGGAILIPSSLALVLAAFPQSKRAVAVTTWGAVGGLAAATGPSLGAAMIQGFGWPAVFYLNLPVGLVAYFFGRRILRESRDQSGSQVPSPVGIVLSIIAMGLLTLAIIQSGSKPWLASRTLTPLVLGLISFLLFIWHSRVSSAPVLDLNLFRVPNFRFANAATFAFSLGFNAMYISNVLFLTQVWQYPTFKAGLALTPGPLLVMPLAVLSGRVASSLGHRPLIVLGGLCFAAAGLWQWFGLTANPAYLTQWLPAVVLGGMGVGLSISPLSSASAHDLVPSRFAIGGAFNGAVRQLGGVIGVALAFALLGEIRMARVAEFKHVFLLMAASGLASAILASGIDTKPTARLDGSAEV